MMLPSLDIHNDDIFSLHDGLTLLLCWWRRWSRLPPPSAPPILFFSLFVSPSTSLSLLPLSPSFPLVFFSRDLQLLNTILFLPTGPPTQDTQRESTAGKPECERTDLWFPVWLFLFLSKSFLNGIISYHRGLPSSGWCCSSRGKNTTCMERKNLWFNLNDWNIALFQKAACNARSYVLINGAVYGSLQRFEWLLNIWKAVCCTWLPLLSAYFSESGMNHCGFALSSSFFF